MEIAITHSSTACVLLEIGGLRILTDPVLDAGKKRYRLGPGAWATRFIGPAIAPAALPPLDVVLLTHAHHLDNLDETGRELLGQARLVLGGGAGLDRVASQAERLIPWQETWLEAPDGLRIKITATPALHGPWWLPGAGEVVGFVLQWEGQRHGALYISGDTVFFRGIRQIAKKFEIGTALLHLGAVHFWPPWPPCFRFTFTGRQAARCARLLKAHTVIPIHYERSVWSHFRESLDSYRAAFRDEGQLNALRWLRHGERTSLEV